MSALIGAKTNGLNVARSANSQLNCVWKIAMKSTLVQWLGETFFAVYYYKQVEVR